MWTENVGFFPTQVFHFHNNAPKSNFDNRTVFCDSCEAFELCKLREAYVAIHDVSRFPENTGSYKKRVF